MKSTMFVNNTKNKQNVGKCMRKTKGITLVALVITVIVMLILVRVAINLTIGENGIFSKSQEGASLYEQMAKKEQNDLSQVEEYFNKMKTCQIIPLKQRQER